MATNIKKIICMYPRMDATAGHIRAAILTVLLCVTACASAQAQPAAPTEAGLMAKGAKRLGAADFEGLYVGNTLSGTTSDGQSFHVFVESKATLRMEFEGKRTQQAWHAGKDGEFCSVDKNETTCTREYQHEDAIHSFNVDGTYGGTARIKAGNPEKL